MADFIKDELTKLNIKSLPSPTNQIFVSFSKKVALELIDTFGLEKWSENDKEIVVRIVTSFATKKGDANELISYIKNLKQ